MSIQERLYNDLQTRKLNNAFRILKTPAGLVDFCSNDYLGIAKELHFKSEQVGGSTGSRLISGNTHFTEELEEYLASFYQAESALIFNSGYVANLGIFSSIPKRGDYIIYDELVHASIRDGVRLSLAKSYSFVHNSISDLEKKLKSVELMTDKAIFVAIESIYSMDGDSCPLIEIIELCEKYGAHIIIDEAHSTGILGEKGEGMVVELGLQDRIFIRLQTFGKGMGCHGAAVVGSETLRNYLINFSRPFIYTTALPDHSLKVIRIAHEILIRKHSKLGEIKQKIQFFKEKIKPLNFNIIESSSPIQCIIIPTNDKVKSVANKVQKAGFDVRPILSPTVSEGSERLRICLHTYNTENEIKGLIQALKK